MYRPGRARHHPVANGLAPSKSECQIPRWYTSHAFLTNETLEAQRQQALHRSEAIQFPPATTQEFKANEILSLCKGVFFIPVLESQEALDTFLLLHGILYILQFTIGQNHDIKLGFVEFLQRPYLNA